MRLNVDTDKIKEMGKAIGDAAEKLNVYVDNLIWEFSLPTYEREMLTSAIYYYKINSLGITPEEYDKLVNLSDQYRSLENFYGREAEIVKIELEHGIKRLPSSNYDPNISIDEAYSRYVGNDRETCKKAYDMINKAEENSQNYEKSIRETYNGDLATQLGLPPSIEKPANLDLLDESKGQIL